MIIDQHRFGGGIPNDLDAYYPFNGNANDESGNGHDGNVNGATLISDRHGNINSAYSFDGINDNIIIPDLVLKQSAQTLCFWVKWRAGQNLIRGIGGGANRYYINNTGVTRGTNVGYPMTLRTNEWDFVCVYWDDGSLLKIYVNDVNIHDSTYTKVVGGGDSSMTLAAFQGGTSGFANCDMDDIRSYLRELTDQERTALYNE